MSNRVFVLLFLALPSAVVTWLVSSLEVPDWYTWLWVVLTVACVAAAMQEGKHVDP